jgi:hypothetical protein
LVGHRPWPDPRGRPARSRLPRQAPAPFLQRKEDNRKGEKKEAGGNKKKLEKVKEKKRDEKRREKT